MTPRMVGGDVPGLHCLTCPTSDCHTWPDLARPRHDKQPTPWTAIVTQGPAPSTGSLDILSSTQPGQWSSIALFRILSPPCVVQALVASLSVA